MNSPGHVSASPNGTFLVADYGNRRILVFTNAKAPVLTVTTRTGTTTKPAAALTGAAGFLLIALSPWLSGDLLGLTLGVGGSLGVCAVVWSIPGRVLCGAQAAVGIAAINAIGNLGDFLSPTIMGLVIQHTGTPAAALLAGAGFAFAFRALDPAQRSRR